MSTLQTSSIKNNPYFVLAVLILASLAVMLVCLTFGSSDISIRTIFDWMSGSQVERYEQNILQYVRIPRIIAAFICGGALALSGLLLQTSLNNVLAAPGIIGINSGAGFLVVAAAAAMPAVFSLKVPMAFIGAMGTALLVYAIASKAGSSKTAIIMVGIAVSSLFGAGIDLIVTFVPEAIMDKTSFYIGGLSGVNMSDICFVLPWLLIGIIGALILSPGLNLLLLGDESAMSLGLHAKRYRFLAIMFAAMLSACAVCIGGLLGFIGLIIPHIVRFIFGNNHKKIIPYSFFMGGIFLVICDTIARTAFAPYEIPVGILLSFAGVPFFIYLLISKRRRLAL